MPVTTPVARTFPSGGIGPNNSIDCSPWTSIAGSNEPREASGRASPAHHGRERGQDPLGPVGRILGRELQLEVEGVQRARSDTEGVEQAVGRRPGSFDRVRGGPHGIGVDGHAGPSVCASFRVGPGSI